MSMVSGYGHFYPSVSSHSKPAYSPPHSAYFSVAYVMAGLSFMEKFTPAKYDQHHPQIKTPRVVFLSLKDP